MTDTRPGRGGPARTAASAGRVGPSPDGASLAAGAGPAGAAATVRPAQVAARDSGRSWSLPTTIAALAVGGGVLLVLRSPHVAGSYGFCPSLLLGIACPGCGGMRATADLLHGDVASAWSYNPLVVVGLPLVLALTARWFADARADRPPWSPPAWLAWVGLGLVLAFWVLRNVPALTPYLGPLAVP
ncbi:MAG TPA: DUF2752 domain-containing protein [Micrococcales bacterium]|uniref:DUF2752 domain-containing protein n=1 Tax=Miniimonas arenae TaxID=676201 RepID=A0A5C5BGV9_9MICO|nr:MULTISPECIES: DUF2752 domain-containing protein [Miniimonas]TNU77030.1 DUF2752 domain-containing protein [Miniimonas arenae]HCX85349.1 DUF2752 domain-containing protein [Micrococcales bacterium]